MKKKDKKNWSLIAELRKRFKENDSLAKRKRITIFYDDFLARITGRPFEEAMVSANFTFADSLNSLFLSYPEIPRQVLPGELGFLLNGIRPLTFDVLQDGDRIEFKTVKGFRPSRKQHEIVKRQVETTIAGLLAKYQAGFSLDEVKKIIFNENGFDDFQPVIDVFLKKIEDVNELNPVLDTLMWAWNYFSHRSLGGLSPAEKIADGKRVA